MLSLSSIKRLFLLIILLSCTSFMSAKKENVTHLESPYYVCPRTDARHIDLSANWELTACDTLVQSLNELAGKEWLQVETPTSVQMAYYRAGKLPHPYEHFNSKLYAPLEQQVHYYRKTFATPELQPGDNVFLSFEGIDYAARIWVNGQCLGEHAGMFGGPTIRVNDYLKKDGTQNKVIVEVRSANYRNPNYPSHTPKTFVRSWFFSRSSEGVTPFFHLGLWNTVRLDMMPAYHIERPYLVTRSVAGDKAILDFSTEIFAGRNTSQYTLHPFQGGQLNNSLANAPLVKDDLCVKVIFRDGDRIAYTKTFTPAVIEGRCWMEETIELDQPRLWYPNRMGEQALYTVSVELYVNGTKADEIAFDYGIRTIEHVRSAGVRTQDRWADWQFVINGQKIFVKGMNWMPLDALSDLNEADYDWALRSARDMGVQMLRIWGTGYMETDTFYDLCNRYGIMVWQDFSIANFDTPEWPQTVWEAQVCRNIFRLRNQPSLAVWCGGNEFNAYSVGNTASIGILERNLALFDPSRLFLRTSPDEGSIHLYSDMDPNCYKDLALVPYISETGIHTMSSARNNRKIIDAADFENLGAMTDESFKAAHPDLIHHYAEFHPSRVPRMLSRATHIDDMSDPLYENMVEATQVGAGEFYQIMSEGVQSNYPVTVGLMPWVYKRPWPVVAAIQLMDAFGQPTAPYYFLKRTYEPVHVMADLPRVLFAPGQTFAVKADVLNGVGQPALRGTIEIRILNDRFREMEHYVQTVDVTDGTSVTKVELGSFTVPADYKERFFFVVVTLKNTQEKILSQSCYWPRTIRQMEDPAFAQKYNTQKVANPSLTDGPWLKPTIARNKTTLKVTDLKDNGDGTCSFTLHNTGKYPSPMTCLDVDDRIWYASDNFFWLEPQATKTITLRVKPDGMEASPLKIRVTSWNAKTLTFINRK